MRHNKTCFGGILLFTGTQCKNLHQSSVMMTRVTFFFYSAGPHRRSLHWPHLTQEKLRSGFEKNEGEWTSKGDIRKEEIPGSRCSMHDYILTYSRLSRENIWVLDSQQMGP